MVNWLGWFSRSIPRRGERGVSINKLLERLAYGLFLAVVCTALASVLFYFLWLFVELVSHA